MRYVLAFLVTLAFPTMAFAHPGHIQAVGFLHGFEHPAGGLDHILAMIAVGVFAYMLGGKALWLVPLSFVGMMVVGFALGLGQVGLPFVELFIALSSVVIGAVAAMGRPMPVVAAMGLVGVFAVFHGHAHGAEMPGTAGGLDYALGFIAATAALHATGMLASFGAARLAGHYGRPLGRIAAGAFALGGIGVLAGWI